MLSSDFWSYCWHVCICFNDGVCFTKSVCAGRGLFKIVLMVLSTGGNLLLAVVIRKAADMS